ncbi:uncharacterized protein A4U43_C05F30050 [Asparagus officinalis]|uniref:Cytochrome b5 heme-binding domain-containing protein n=1 Tax=Asparagus officinalis TaxID=4686 RepID=A0A5P1EVZ2_ASPOF|nr:cytochrome b5 domain-containing protein RLF [Asparagus officinalis]ONK70082.1 uncharacterized protein A4U43_C05F30050 [Asparagus officinalis]
MSDSSDFTFCQVGLQSNDDHLESPEKVPNISKINLDESSKDGVNNHINNAIQDNKSHDNETKCPEFSASPCNNGGELDSSTAKLMEKTGHAQEGVQEKKPTVKKPAARAKVPFEKGYSQMDWLKLTRTDPDLAGLRGRSNRRLISLDEVKQHKTEGSVWTVLKGRVYNISPYMKFHPGGVDMLMKAAGKDCTALFNKYHAWVNAEFLLEKCLVGMLDDTV